MGLFSKKSKKDAKQDLAAPPPPPVDLPEAPADPQISQAPPADDMGIPDLPPMPGDDPFADPASATPAPEAVEPSAPTPQETQAPSDDLPSFDDLGDIPDLPTFDDLDQTAAPVQPDAQQSEAAPVAEAVEPETIGPMNPQSEEEELPPIQEEGDVASQQHDLPTLEELEAQEGEVAHQDLTKIRERSSLSGPLFVNVEDYRVVMHHVNYIQDDVAECEAYYQQLEHMKTVMHDSYQQFQDSLLQMHRKIMLIDNIVFER